MENSASAEINDLNSAYSADNYDDTFTRGSQKDPDMRYYALYACNVNTRSRQTTAGSGSTNSDSESTTSSTAAGGVVSSDPPTDNTAPNDGSNNKEMGDDFHLTVLATNLQADCEIELRSFVSRRLSKGHGYNGTGHIASIDLGLPDPASMCYSCLIQKQTPPQSAVDSLDPAVPLPSNHCQYVVCFVTDSDGGLDLFCHELNEYSKQLLSMLDEHKPISNPQYLKLGYDCFLELSDLTTKVQDALHNWHQQCLEYFSRCVALFQQDLDILIHCALVDGCLTIEGADRHVHSDIMKFVKACSLSDFLCNSESKAEDTLVDVGNSYQSDTDVRANIILSITEDGHVFDCQDTSQFCRDWADALIKADTSDPVLLRQYTENFKLKAIQDMNTLKRLVRQAERDHYALYRLFMFLKDCGNGPVLLRNVKMEETIQTNVDASNVVTIVEQFLDDTGGFDM